LGVGKKASRGEIKNSYFQLAKLFHPDRFHREDPASLRRIQSAFTEIAHAYDTLKSEDSREGYNIKMAKEAEFREKHRVTKKDEVATPEERQTEQGLQSFEQAVEAMNEEEYAAAAGHFARAVHYSPQNALYHAYLGKALSSLEKQHHKAEAEMQTAIKLDPRNAKIRMMLVEFFVEMKMSKRAVGELNRLLEMIPGNPEAMKMLAKLQPTAEVQ
jgi:curved DNA-binding protein CbpA